MENKKNKIKNDNFLEACMNAFAGLKVLFKTQINIKIQLCVTILVMLAAIFFQVSKVEILFLCLSIFLVFISETLNTAIEATVDLYTEKFHEKAKIAKDVAAGAVALSAINSVVVAVIIFYDKIIIS